MEKLPMRAFINTENSRITHVAISGDGESAGSAELVVTIETPNETPMTVRLGAGAASGLFASLSNAALLALQHNASVNITYTPHYSTGITPTLNQIVFTKDSFSAGRT
jgi:hypothetical protein